VQILLKHALTSYWQIVILNAFNLQVIVATESRIYK
jgi:hypothetical protein